MAVRAADTISTSCDHSTYVLLIDHPLPAESNWQDGVCWSGITFMPREVLDATPLKLVAGIGNSDEHDRALSKAAAKN